MLTNKFSKKFQLLFYSTITYLPILISQLQGSVSKGKKE